MSDLNKLLRPTVWEDIIGQSDLKELCQRALEEDHFPKFSIFYGPSGVGKSVMAEVIGRTIAAKYSLDPAKVVRKYNMAELVGKKDVIGILSSIFELKSLTSHTVFILEEVHALNQMSEQAPFLEYLTKIPDDVYIIMCTTRISALLSELKNRAMLFQLGYPSPAECVDFIHEVTRKLGLIPMSPSGAKTLASVSAYSPRQIVKNIEFFSSSTVISEEDLARFYKTVSHEKYLLLLQMIISPAVSLYDTVAFIKQLSEEVTYGGLIVGLRDVVLTILLEVATKSTEHTFSNKDRELAQTIVSSIDDKIFMKILDGISRIPPGSYDDAKLAFFELVKLKLAVGNKTAATVLADNQAACSKAATVNMIRAQQSETQKTTHEFKQVDTAALEAYTATSAVFEEGD